ncbi:MAG: hypothetical protein GF333_06320 [Candidatus Omnitrophica bacterium]|nr:hypothetical protein [Candidatus Omnitrophota bacterium]
MHDEQHNILIGVCGGISSYKTCELVRLCVKAGCRVKVVMTPAAARFVSPRVFRSLSGEAVFVRMFSPGEEQRTKHIGLAQWAEACVIAPLSANTLSKLAIGICDNLLTTVMCAFPEEKKIFCAPAMNTHMWNNTVILDNTDKLFRRTQYELLSPGRGALACGSSGEGRMMPPEEIFHRVDEYLSGKSE